MSSIASPLASSTLAPTTASSFSPAPKAATGLQQPDFLKLLMAQMAHQNPTSPTSANEFVSQMAQFSSVQGITQLNQSIANLVALQSLTQGVSLIGKTVSYTDASGKAASGTVGSVAMVSGQPQLVINNTNVNLSQIQSIQATPTKTVTGSSAAPSGI
jgi:flagellar basal-body rod modification protein FlgD